MWDHRVKIVDTETVLKHSEVTLDKIRLNAFELKWYLFEEVGNYPGLAEWTSSKESFKDFHTKN